MKSRLLLLVHWYFLLRAAGWLALAFVRADWYFRRRAWRALALPNADALTSKEKRRLQHYFYGTTYLSVIFCSLRGRIRSHPEKWLFTNLAALSYFFDDLVDAYRHRDDSGMLWQDNPEIYLEAADERGLALHFLRNIYGTLPPANLPEFREFMHRVFNVETAGSQQSTFRMHLDINELGQITAEKGGFSVLLFRRVLAHSLSAAERKALYEFGYLIQLCDDVFDVWFDLQSNTRTLPLVLLQANDVGALQRHFEAQVEITASALRATPYPAAQVGTALRVAYFIIAITRVCLHHYAQLSKKHGTLPLHDRHSMVLDMERWPNRIRAAREVLRPV